MTGRCRWRLPGPGRAGPLLVGLLLATACSGSPQTPDTPEPEPAPAPLAGCAGLLAAPPLAAAPPPAGAGASDPLPGITLPCFNGGEPVPVDALRGPAVVNLWASWCGPCREELPVFQEYADRTAGRVHVVGVVTQDGHDPAAWFADGAGVSFPALFDREGLLWRRLPAAALPVTLFVDADGRVRHLHPAPLDARELAALAADHLGVSP
jgi:thiol-disulfide isomerase/thioredoxin